MKRLRLVGILALLAALAVFAAACGGEEAAPPAEEPAATDAAPPAEEPAPPAEPPAEEPPAAEPPAEAGPEPGGTYRVDVESAFDFWAAFDPTGEYTAIGWSFYNLLIRKLMTYPGTEGNAGNEIYPDLAADFPEISEDGLLYTFTLKDGIKFGPPLSREITSNDIAFAFERLATPEIGDFGYPLYYQVIDGFSDFHDGKADTISGIETPDDKTIVFHLTEPTGDFLFRLAMAATGPIPEEVAGCFPEGGDYGRFVISSGPYMIEGSDELDATSCETMKPISGYDPEAHLLLVRNPDYDPATDSPELRENYPDRFEFRINSNVEDCFNKTREGLIEDNICSETGKIIKEYTEDPELQDNLKAYQDDSIFYINMNLAMPPFDDVHVRRAANFVMNRAAMVQAWGGPVVGDVATHVLPPSMAPPELEGYDPFPSENHEGDVDAAMEEMKQSKYDTDGDGLCDAPECTDVLNIMGTTERDKVLIPIMEESMAKIGITLKTRQVDDAYSVVANPKEKIPITGTMGWGKDYADAYTYYLYLWDGRGITPTSASNATLLGLTPEMAAKIGIEYPEGGVPSVDADADACVATVDPTERLTCWGNLDKKLTEEIAAWVPYIWRNNTNTISDAVTQWDFDQSTGMQAWVHVAVDQSKQK